MNRFSIAGLLLLLAFSGTTLAQKNANKGDRYFDKNLFEEAIKYYELEVKSGSREYRDYSKKRIAECYRISGQFEEAEKAYRKILKRKKNQRDPINYLNYGKSLKSSAKFAEAKVQFEEFIKKSPDDPMGPIYLQSCDSAQKWLDETIGKEASNLTQINTSETDMAPVFITSSQIAISSSREGTKKAFISFDGGMDIKRLDLFTIELPQLNQDSLGPLPNIPDLSTPLHEGPATFSNNGQEVYFTRMVKGQKNRLKNSITSTLQVYYSKIDSTGTWTEPISAFAFNSSEYSVGHPSLSITGDTIYFMSDMRGGQGATDIYYSVKDSLGRFIHYTNLGKHVNTFGHELFPYISKNGKLYFSSDAHPGMGKLDIFSAELKHGGWSNVENLKPPVNSIGNDFGIALDGTNPRGFFTSDRFGGIGAEDIYSFSNDSPLELVLDSGQLYIRNLKFFNGLKYVLTNNSGEKIPLIAENGKIVLPLSNNVEYTLTAKKSFFPYNKVIIQLGEKHTPNSPHISVQPIQKEIYVKGFSEESLLVTNHNTNEQTTLTPSNNEFHSGSLPPMEQSTIELKK